MSDQPSRPPEIDDPDVPAQDEQALLDLVNGQHVEHPDEEDA